MLVIEKVASTTHRSFGRFLARYVVYIAAILDLDKESPDLSLPILQYYFNALVRLESSDDDLSKYRTQKSYKFFMGNSHPETIRAYMLYATLAHERGNIGTLEWLLGQPNCPRRCKAAGDAHLFTALFEAPRDSMGENRACNARRAAACLGKLDTLMESGYMDIHSQIDNGPTQTYLDNLKLLMKRDDQPETRNGIFGPKHLRAFYWNNTKNHPTPLSYAMNHFISVDLRGKGHEQQYIPSLQTAFHLIRKGADPRRVDPNIRKKVLAEYRRRAAADESLPQSKQQFSKTFCRDYMAGMTAQHFCEHSKELAYTHMVPERFHMIPIFFVAHNTHVLPAGRAYFR